MSIHFKINSFVKKIVLLASSVMLLTSCARQISSDVYAARQVGEVSTTYAGYIKSVREVCMEQGEQLEDNGLGLVGGGVAGGVAGSAIGRGHFVPTAAGAIVGAVAGSLVEKKLKQQSAFEYIVELENGGLITVVQGRDHLYNVGQPVYVIVSQTGRSRITPQ
jgi:outer membrane lipoprotein SlyB